MAVRVAVVRKRGYAEGIFDGFGVFSGWFPRIQRQGLAVVISILVWGGAMIGFGVAGGFAHGQTGALLWIALAFLAIGGAADMVSVYVRETLIQLYSFSKSYAIPGHRLGSVIAAPALIEQIAKILDCVQICPPRAAQAAIAWAVAETRLWREGVRDMINRRIGMFSDVVAAAPGWSISAIGTYFAYVRHPLHGASEAVAERLAREAGLVALPGSFFGPDQEAHLRFAFANADEALLPGVAERLRAAG